MYNKRQEKHGTERVYVAKELQLVTPNQEKCNQTRTYCNNINNNCKKGGDNIEVYFKKERFNGMFKIFNTLTRSKSTELNIVP